MLLRKHYTIPRLRLYGPEARARLKIHLRIKFASYFWKEREGEKKLYAQSDILAHNGAGGGGDIGDFH